MNWAYGVTTVPERFDELLPRTLHSLALAGFGEPRLFVDGEQHPDIYQQRFGLEATVRHPRVHVYANWLLGMWELYLRFPDADRYAMFQDDLVCVKNLRRYLETVPYPKSGYLNLYTFMNNEAIVMGQERGWIEAEWSGPQRTGYQRGRGAVALAFSREALIVLLGCNVLAERVQNTQRCKANNLRRGWTHVDGAVVAAMNQQNWIEYVHNPSLVQHTGMQSQTASGSLPLAKTFPGEECDAMEWLA